MVVVSIPNSKYKIPCINLFEGKKASGSTGYANLMAYIPMRMQTLKNGFMPNMPQWLPISLHVVQEVLASETCGSCRPQDGCCLRWKLHGHPGDVQEAPSRTTVNGKDSRAIWDGHRFLEGTQDMLAVVHVEI